MPESVGNLGFCLVPLTLPCNQDSPPRFCRSIRSSGGQRRTRWSSCGSAAAAERAVGDQLLGIHDRLVDTLGVKGSIAAELGAGYLTTGGPAA